MKLAKNLMWGMGVVSMGVVAVLYTRIIRPEHSVAFQLRLNWYSAVYVASIAGFVAMLALIRRASRTRTTFWFSMWILVNLLLAVGGFLRSSSLTLETYAFWYHITIWPLALLGWVLFFFILSYTEHEKYIYNPLLWISFLLVTLSLTSLSSMGNDVFNYTGLARHSWGYADYPAAGKFYGLGVLWIESLIVASIVLLANYYERIKASHKKRQQTRLIIIGLLVPLVGGTITIVITPLFHIEQPPLDILFDFIQVCIVAYAIYRYQLFAVDPVTLSDTVLETMDEAVMTVNTEYGVELVNPAAARFFGMHVHEIRGRSLQDLFTADNFKTLKAKLQTGANETFEMDVKSADRVVPVSLAASKVHLNGNTKSRIVGSIIVFRDIQEERNITMEIEKEVIDRTEELAKEKATLQTLIDNLPVGMFVASVPSGEILLTNTKGEEISGHTFNPSAHHEKATDVYKIVDADGAAYPKAKLPYVITNKDHVPAEIADVYLQKPDKKMTALHMMSAPIAGTSGTVESVAVVFEDITEQRLVERSRDEFFSIASHELRTPLTSIKGNASMLIEYFPYILKDSVIKEMLVDVRDSSGRLIEIVNDFLDASRLEQGKISFNKESFLLGMLIEKVVYEMKAMLNEKGLYLTFDESTLHALPKVMADEDRTKQVLYNLIGNAVKFTDHGGITVNAKQEDGFVKVYVSDTGRGMSPANQQLLFRKFQQANSSLLTRDTSRGTGLGLYISKLIVESMGGTIGLDHSEEGKGTTFVFALPVASENQHTRVKP